MTHRKLTILIALTLLTAFAVQVRADGPSDAQEANALNVAQYSQPPRVATVEIKASTQPTEEGKAPPPPDVRVDIPMPLPIALPQPKFDDKGWSSPQNVWQLVVATVFTLVIAAAAYPRLREMFSNFGKKKGEPPPPSV